MNANFWQVFIQSDDRELGYRLDFSVSGCLEKLTEKRLIRFQKRGASRVPCYIKRQGCIGASNCHWKDFSSALQFCLHTGGFFRVRFKTDILSLGKSSEKWMVGFAAGAAIHIDK